MNETVSKGTPTGAGPTEEAGRAEELALYAKLRKRVLALLAEVRDTITGEAVTEAVEKAAAELKELGQHSRENVTRLAAALRKDLASTGETLRPRLEGLKADAEKATQVLRERGGAFWHEALEEGGRLAELSRDKGGSVAVQAAHAVAHWSQRLGEKLDQALVYNSGELTHGGEFRCTACGTTVTLKKPGHLPPCPKCHAVQYRRS